MGSKHINEKTIRRDLLRQLETAGKATHTNIDRVEEYLRQRRIAMELYEDIEKRGAVFQDYDARGNLVWKDNTSVKQVLAVSKEMTSILKALDLNAPPDLMAGADDL